MDGWQRTVDRPLPHPLSFMRPFGMIDCQRTLPEVARRRGCIRTCCEHSDKIVTGWTVLCERTLGGRRQRSPRQDRLPLVQTHLRSSGSSISCSLVKKHSDQLADESTRRHFRPELEPTQSLISFCSGLVILQKCNSGGDPRRIPVSCPICLPTRWLPTSTSETSAPTL